MAQTPPTTSAPGARSLPRPKRVPPKASAKPRLVPIDGLWMVVFALVLLISAAFFENISVLKSAAIWAAAGSVAALYLLGAQIRDRMTGVVAALLLATSAPFILSTDGSGWLTWFTFATIASLASFVAGSRTLALIFAACATALYPDGLLLGALFLILIAFQHIGKALAFTGLYLAVGAGAYIARTNLEHQGLVHDLVRPQPSLLSWVIAPGMLVLLWFLIPFCVELTDAPRRLRWFPVLCWTILLVCGESLFHFRAGLSVLPIVPLVLLFIGGGVARLLPVMLGDLANPIMRYVLASVAILALPILRASVTSPRHYTQTQTMAARPVTNLPLVTRVQPIHAAIHRALPPIVHSHPNVQKPQPKTQVITVPHHVVEVTKLPPKNAVREFTWKNGHMVRRTKWAIEWDKTHPKL